MRKFWMTIGSIFTVAALAFGTYTTVSALARDVEHHRDVLAAGGIAAIEVDTDSGSIEVVGDPDATEITVEAEVSHGLRRTGYSLERRGDTIVASGDCNILVSFWCRVDMTITIPADIAVDIDSSNGFIDVTDVDGPVVMNTSNGTIDMIGLGGNVTVSSSNGAIRGHGLAGDTVRADTSNGAIELTFAKAPLTVSADTSNGSVKITVPDDDTAYAVETDTSNGSTDTTVRTDPTSDHTITADTSNGSISIFYPTS